MRLRDIEGSSDKENIVQPVDQTTWSNSLLFLKSMNYENRDLGRQFLSEWRNFPEQVVYDKGSARYQKETSYPHLGSGVRLDFWHFR